MYVRNKVLTEIAVFLETKQEPEVNKSSLREHLLERNGGLKTCGSTFFANGMRHEKSDAWT